MQDVSIGEAYALWAVELVRYATVLVGADDAPDVVADTFAALLQSNRSTWAAVRDVRLYLYGAIANTARARHRSAARRRRREVAAAVHPRSNDAPIDPTVRVLLTKLSLQQRSVIYLTYWEDMTPNAVATTLGISEGAVKRHLARARAALRKVLQ